MAQSSQAPLGFCADKNWLSAPQINKTHADRGSASKEGQTPGAARVQGKRVEDVCLGVLPAPSPDSVSPINQLALASGSPFMMKTTPVEFSSKFCLCKNKTRTTTANLSCSSVPSPCYLVLPSPRPHVITGQTLPCFSRHRSRGGAVL